MLVCFALLPCGVNSNEFYLTYTNSTVSVFVSSLLVALQLNVKFTYSIGTKHELLTSSHLSLDIFEHFAQTQVP